MKIAAVLALVCLLVVDVRGQARDPRLRCLCADVGLKMVRLNRVEKVEIFPSSPSCGKQEIVATLKYGAGKKCLNPESNFVQELIKRMMEKRLQQ
ncbi:C-X-C motif chemokine 11-6-like [Salminus brasiliensis]|uniref:C-X-C motif chemokine 11-6-like n=1 Tax=Salminus brasiliensis TaxID=930266 RepID=UPI003B83500A